MVGLQIRTLNIFTVFRKNEYSLYRSIPADGFIPAVTYIFLYGFALSNIISPDMMVFYSLETGALTSSKLNAYTYDCILF